MARADDTVEFIKHSADMSVFILGFSLLGIRENKPHNTADNIFPAVTERKTIIPAGVSG